MIGPRHFYTILRYPQDQFPFAQAVEALLGEPLVSLAADRPVATRATDQLTPWHQPFYGCAAIQMMYGRFVRQFVAELFYEDFYYQRIPTFRVHQCGNLAVGERHRDGDYGHPDGEVNFWLPLTQAEGTATIQIDDWTGMPRGVEAFPGELVVFDGRNIRHGNYINMEGYSRVSFDFRCLPVSAYQETEAISVNSQLHFAPGEYYALEPMRGAGR